MSTINAPDSQIVDENGHSTQRTKIWFSQVTDLQIVIGSGSPEAVVDAIEGKLYMDSSGTAGAILYIKRDADIAGDTTKGWILV